MRPEHLTLADSGGIPTEVVVVEPTGADTFVACRHHGADFSVVFRERHDFAPGSTIHLQPDLQHAHLFDAAQRLAAWRRLTRASIPSLACAPHPQPKPRRQA